MKRLLLVFCCLILLSSCVNKDNQQNDVQEYINLNAQKQLISKQYLKLMENPDNNKPKIKNLDAKMHDINAKLKLLSKKDAVKEYLRITFNVDSKKSVSGKKTSAKDSDKFDYYVDNDEVDAQYDFSNSDLVDEDNSNTDDSFENESLIESDSLIEPDEGFYSKDLNNTAENGSDANNSQLDESVDEDFEFQDDDTRNE